jgi:chromosome segregation ATPase
MNRLFRALFTPAPASEVERAAPEADDRLRRLEQRVEEFERHRWELQHRINVLQEDLSRTRERNAAAAREACRAELAVFRRDFEPAFQEIYGALGAKFRRLDVPRVEDPLVDRFGEAEKRRRDEGPPAETGP